MSCSQENRTHTVRKHLESYGSVYIDPAGNEVSEPHSLCESAARRVARYWNGYVVRLP
jgi:hypothetical protein